MHGMRLKPGTQVNESILNLALATAASSDRANEYLDDACMFDRNVDVAIEALLKCGGSVSQTAAELGVTVRSLQRLFVQNALPTPSYWRSLARVRLAATNLDDTLSLAEHAIQLGFSDQAHMTREFGRWFGVTPAKFATDSQLQVALKQPGLAT